jgi:hypothetical protein
MNRWKLALPLVTLMFCSVSAPGCVVRERQVVVHEAPPPEAEEEASGQEVQADAELPAEQVETPPPPPTREHVWVRGHWRWSGKRWVWVQGRWIVRRQGSEWVAGHWVRGRRGWVWVSGRWVRRR